MLTPRRVARAAAVLVYRGLARIFYPRCPWIVEWYPLSLRGYVVMQRILNLNGARSVAWPVHFTSRVSGHITVGSMTSPGYSPGSYFNGVNGIHFGSDVWIGPGVKVISGDHDREHMDRHKPAPPVRIGSRVWIGANAIILPGVQIGDDCVIGAGAVVTRDVPAGAVAVGNPARVLRLEEPADGGRDRGTVRSDES